MQTLPAGTLATRLRHAREDHARCLRFAAEFRVRHACGERGMVPMHAWAIGHARSLRAQILGLMVTV